MRMKDPYPTFSHFVSQIRERHPQFAYIHGVEGHEPGDQLDFLRKIWKEDPSRSQIFLSASRHDLQSALQTADEKNDVVVFGRHFISNVSKRLMMWYSARWQLGLQPDLPLRFKNNIPLTPYDASTFYSVKSAKGYIDYPFGAASQWYRLLDYIFNTRTDRKPNIVKEIEWAAL